VYIWEAVVGPFHDKDKVPADNWFGILWKDGSKMAGYDALAKLFNPIPKNAAILRRFTSNSKMATAAFVGDGKIVVAIVNDLDEPTRITVKMTSAKLSMNGYPATSVWSRSPEDDMAVVRSISLIVEDNTFGVTVTMTVDSLLVLTFTKG
jgi:hypothetical protein